MASYLPVLGQRGPKITNYEHGHGHGEGWAE